MAEIVERDNGAQDSRLQELRIGVSLMSEESSTIPPVAEEVFNSLRRGGRVVYRDGLENRVFYLGLTPITPRITPRLSMGRKAKPIDGVISDVCKVEPHKGQWRIRYRKNGIPAETYRADEGQAEALYLDLTTRAVLKEGTKKTVITELSIEQVRQAEFAFEVLASAGLFDRSSDLEANIISVAARKYAEAVHRQGPDITVSKAYEQFLQNTAREDSTRADYNRYILNGFIPLHGEKPVCTLTPMDCHEFVFGYQSNLDQFKAYGYLYAFMNFCTGKNNPAIDPTNGKPWISRNPMNFKKPVYKSKDIISYDLKEVKKILRAAIELEGKPKTSNRAKGRTYSALGYLVFRLFSLCRFEEFNRFVEVGGGSDWKTNKLIDLKNNRLNFNGEVYLKVSNGEDRGRKVEIHPTFRAWIDYFMKNKISFSYDRVSEEDSRREGCPVKFGDKFTNLLRHTAITMHVIAFKNSSTTARLAGTSTDKIDNNYLDGTITEREALAFYKLTPASFGL